MLVKLAKDEIAEVINGLETVSEEHASFYDFEEMRDEAVAVLKKALKGTANLVDLDIDAIQLANDGLNENYSDNPPQLVKGAICYYLQESRQEEDYSPDFDLIGDCMRDERWAM